MKHTTSLKYRMVFVCMLLFTVLLFGATGKSSAFTVTNLTATYSNGQVFLTWTNPTGSNLQYNVYRSTSQLTATSQLNTTTYIGFVRDNSAKNVHMSMLQNQDIYYKITDNGQPLASTKGLYVVTCTANKKYYYAVTVKDLSANTEAKKLTMGKNSLSVGINETVAKPQPVFQDSLLVNSGDMKYRYVQFGNNQETSLYPALNSTGSYGFNFYIAKRGSASSFPLYVVYEGEPNNAWEGVGLGSSISNCYVLGVDDWLPVPGSDGLGENSRYCCYHENFNIYSNTNPVPTTGVVKTFTQRRYIEAIHWAKSHFPIDQARVYVKGGSQTGLGALLTAAIIPQEIACIYVTVEPMSLVTGGTPILEQMWGKGTSKLNTDILNPTSLIPLSFSTLTDMKKMANINENLNLPLLYDVHGKNDVTVAWSASKVEWLDSLESNKVGGAFYWDQRQHNGTGKNFIDDEIMPDFTRYATNISYPAFSNCSINQNPGNGTPSNGDPYGAINGYLDWDDAITDNNCDYSVNVMVKDFYVGGVLDPEQYNTCTTDITLRRLQKFHPLVGSTITWQNFNSSGQLIQNGSLIYLNGLITIKNLTVNKSGNNIKLHILNCLKAGEDMPGEQLPQQVYFTRSSTGYTAHADVNHDGEVIVNVYDLLGRISSHQKVYLAQGSNTFDIAAPGSGIFLVEIKGAVLSHTEKLMF